MLAVALCVAYPFQIDCTMTVFASSATGLPIGLGGAPLGNLFAAMPDAQAQAVLSAALLLEHINQPAAAERVRQAVVDLHIPHVASRVGPYVTVSIGLAELDLELTPDFDALFEAADQALYRAKETGRNTVYCADVQHGCVPVVHMLIDPGEDRNGALLT